MLKAIETKSLEDLIQLRGELDTLIATRQQEQKKELKKKFLEMAKEQGLSIDEILSTAPQKRGTKKGTKAPVKYRKGQNTWAGRGRKPAWVNELIEKGEKLEDYLVEAEGQETTNG